MAIRTSPPASPLSRRPTVPLLRSLGGPILLILALFYLGAIGYWIVGGGSWNFADCLYHTALTLTTVGYEDILGVGNSVFGRAFTVVYSVVGLFALLYAFSSITAVLVEGHLNRYFQERRMKNEIDVLSGHFIVCGVGETGRHVVETLRRAGRPVVCVDRDPDRLREIAERYAGTLTVAGDALEEEVLVRAGVERAGALAAALTEDRDNLYVTVTARELNRELRIVAKCIDEKAKKKFLHAGGSAVVSPNHMGGSRIALEMSRPVLARFIEDLGAGEGDEEVRIEEVTVGAAIPAEGVAVNDAEFHGTTGVLVIGVEAPGSARVLYNPAPGWRVHAGEILLVVGTRRGLQRLRTLVGGARG